jgi:hypothetical protein
MSRQRLEIAAMVSDDSGVHIFLRPKSQKGLKQAISPSDRMG